MTIRVIGEGMNEIKLGENI